MKKVTQDKDMIEVVTQVKFYDLKEKKMRGKGDSFEVTQARYGEILKVGPFVKKEVAASGRKTERKTEKNTTKSSKIAEEPRG